MSVPKIVSPNSLELLAPAGGWVQLHAALAAGADAVYFGVEGFNMRAGAKNFSQAELPELVKTVHESGARAYLALNVIVYESELADLGMVLEAAIEAGVDAVIASDIAVIEAARNRGLPVHISTQMSLSNSAAIAFFYGLGVRRFVLARECSLESIEMMRGNLARTLGEPAAAAIEIEAFVHGAMCVSISGRCFMSGFTTGKSANRGACTQPCRREYQVLDKRGEAAFEFTEGHVMSPKDLCALPFLERLIEAGIVSFKIEGRSRSADYVSEVVGAYRTCLDYYCAHAAEKESVAFQEQFSAVKADALERVKRVYNRDFSDGFYFGKPIGDWTTPSGNQSSHQRVYVGKVVNYFSQQGVAELKLEGEALKLGCEIFFEGKQTGWLPQRVESMQYEHQACVEAPKGSCVGVKTTALVRKNDAVYRLVERTLC